MLLLHRNTRQTEYQIMVAFAGSDILHQRTRYPKTSARSNRLSAGVFASPHGFAGIGGVVCPVSLTGTDHSCFLFPRDVSPRWSSFALDVSA